ncbi:hypothetical protein LTR47_010372 [Exophiala xenobiotica]|nr:hypothetical protein LTR47_010372 [Exophiala xenobiotica]KAK5347468.1 hypothetical protein LTR61_008739 [Exophiala xenobiotica]KAK5359852.1 hypothetical protein LTS03_010859 [Exophiala xenobiotica]KAK5364038.1 hypothetical protein LTR11_009036 [Exophiala xenobiotica]
MKKPTAHCHVIFKQLKDPQMRAALRLKAPIDRSSSTRSMRGKRLLETRFGNNVRIDAQTPQALEYGSGPVSDEERLESMMELLDWRAYNRGQRLRSTGILGNVRSSRWIAEECRPKVPRAYIKVRREYCGTS